MSELAQVNVALMRAPLDDPRMHGFVAAFDRVRRVAQDSPGFVWRWSPADGSEVVPSAEGDQIVNLSVWRDYASLHAFTYRSHHGRVLLHRDRWFLPTPQPSTALWWQPDGSRPDLARALARLQHLRAHGPTPQAFSLRRRFGPDGRLERPVAHEA